MTVITLHYASPADDPHKIPRPHRVDVDEHTGEASSAYGGEIGPVGNLLGFCPTPVPDARNWVFTHAKKLYDGEVQAADLAGWYPQFSGERGPMFGYAAAIDRIEVSA